MQAEHARIDPQLNAVEQALAASGAGNLTRSVGALAEGLTGHMRHEENAALPLIETFLGPGGWDASGRAIRKTQGLRAGPEYLPWVLDGAPIATQAKVLALLPPPARAKVTGDPHGQALLDAMEDERQLIGPLQAMADDAFAIGADPGRRCQLLTRLRTRLTSHLAHEEAGALPLISQIMSPRELSAIARAIRGGPAEYSVPWALAHATPHVCTQVLGQLPAPARLLYRSVWLPRFTRNTPAAVNTADPPNLERKLSCPKHDP